jgi:hypothetical protein
VDSPAVLLGLFLGRVIEPSTPHGTYLPDAARRFAPSKGAPSEYACGAVLAVFSGGMRSPEARFCWITSIPSRSHLAKSLFPSTLGVTGLSGCLNPVA